uniref:Ion_trans domain-containing protein n=1 Tax=Heterorhabditis bacteriophora TaxID=37862 RepID=A0A1I7XCU0_HETBA
MRCLFRSTLIPLTLFTYMILASIMLVNLLTALLTREYEEVSGGCSETYWKFEKYYLLAAYESKLWLPPPLSLFYYFLKLISVVIRLFTFFLCICCVCSCKSTVEAKQCGYVPHFLATTFKIIEGKPWGTLKQCLDHDNDEENLKKIRQLIPKENKYQFSSKLKEMMYTDYIRQETSTIITRYAL